MNSLLSLKKEIQNAEKINNPLIVEALIAETLINRAEECNQTANPEIPSIIDKEIEDLLSKVTQHTKDEAFKIFLGIEEIA